MVYMKLARPFRELKHIVIVEGYMDVVGTTWYSLWCGHIRYSHVSGTTVTPF